MADADDQPRSGVSRRDALRLLAASTTTVAAGSVIISQPAFADNGSVACGYEFNSTPTVTLKLKNKSGTKTDSLSISVGNTVGKCKCSGRPSVEYAYHVEIPSGANLGTGSIGWIPSKDASVVSPPVLWPDDLGGPVSVTVGVRVTCPGTSGPVVQCWYGTATTDVGTGNSSPTFPLTVNNSSNNPPGIPPCPPPALRSSQLAASGSITLVPGLLPDTVDEIVDEPTVDLGVVDPSTTTSSTTTTTTTDKPGNGPKPKPPATTTTTSTTTTSTTTTTTSTTTPPTTAPPPSTTTAPPPGG